MRQTLTFRATVMVFSPDDGEHLGTVEVPENVGNINRGGPDWSWLFIPASSSLYRLKCKVSGNRLSLHEVST